MSTLLSMLDIVHKINMRLKRPGRH